MEAATSNEAFDAFGVDAQLDGQPVTVIVDREIELQDELGNVIGRGDRLSFKAADAVGWNAGDLVTVGTEHWHLREPIADDGYIIEFLAHPVSVP